MERLKLPCPLQIVKEMGKEALYLFQCASVLRKVGLINEVEYEIEEWFT